MMREIVLDTETTGLDPGQGHRLVELGCIELLNRIPTGATFHAYLNPERDVPAEAFAIHGLSTEFLKGAQALHRGCRRVPCLYWRCTAGNPQCQLRSRFSLCGAQACRTRVNCARTAWSTRCCWRAASIRQAPTGSMICVCVTVSTTHAAPNMARCSTPRSWPRFIVELIGARQAQLGLAESAKRRANGADGVIVVRARPQRLAPRLSEAEVAAAPRFRGRSRRERAVAKLPKWTEPDG